MNPDPLVRGVVVNHDSGPLVARAVRSLLALDWPADRLDVIVVDNASTDDGLEALPDDPRITLVRNQHNPGFGVAVDQGRAHPGRPADAVLLLNPDAWIEPDGLRRLADWLVAEPRVGAVAPRIVFDRPMASLRLACSPGMRAWLVDVAVDGEPAFDSTHAVSGADRRPRRDGTSPWLLDDQAVLHVPHGTTVTLTLTARRRGQVTVRADDGGGVGAATVTVGSRPRQVEVVVGGEARTIIQNEGSWVAADGTGHNRHYHQAVDEVGAEPGEVFAWCGAAALLRTEMLDDVGGFAEHFFLYYEDTDLSWRARAAGWRHVIEPTAVVHHRHSASTGQGRALTEIHQHRNRVLMVVRNGTAVGALGAVVGLAGTAVAGLARALADRLSGGPGDLTRASWRWRSLAGVVAALPREVKQRRQLGRTARRSRHEVAGELGRPGG